MLKDMEMYIGYAISDCGRVWSHSKDKGSVGKHEGMWLKSTPNKKGYHQTRLTIDGKSYSLLNHREVAKHFIYCDDKIRRSTVNHIDGNKNNNKASNLEWMTNQENMAHAFETGLMDNKIKVMREKTISSIINAGLTYIDIAYEDKKRGDSTVKRAYVKFITSCCHGESYARADGYISTASIRLCKLCQDINKTEAKLKTLKEKRSEIGK